MLRYIQLFLSCTLFLAGWTGIADAFVEWKDSIEPMINLYISIKEQLLAFLPNWIPSFTPEYFLIGGAIAISGVNSSRKYEPSDEMGFLEVFFAGIILSFLWPVVLPIWATSLIVSNRSDDDSKIRRWSQDREVTLYEFKIIGFMSVGVVLVMFLMIDI